MKNWERDRRHWLTKSSYGFLASGLKCWQRHLIINMNSSQNIQLIGCRAFQYFLAITEVNIKLYFFECEKIGWQDFCKKCKGTNQQHLLQEKLAKNRKQHPQDQKNFITNYYLFCEQNIQSRPICPMQNQIYLAKVLQLFCKSLHILLLLSWSDFVPWMLSRTSFKWLNSYFKCN